ncbi:endonuclease [Nocardioides nanhaiensis]|uniref:Endonuclease YhcR N-terminal domain-containing protein n=1 Tax=Nocardioides nanhaiensis TaxID=1476871 RepID=A0ABP8WRE3_9ACTN
MILGNRRPHALLLLAPLVVLACLLGWAAPPSTGSPGSTAATATTSPVSAQAVLDVATARGAQDGRTATVRGYVVGQPTSSTTVVRSGFPNDYAIALADAPGVTDTARMLYVQVPSAFRSAWGLRSRPAQLDTAVEVTGTLVAYFSRPGLTGATAFTAAGEGGGDGGDGGDGGTGDDAYWAPAQGKQGVALEAALHDIVSTGVTRLSYDQVWDALKVTDRDPADPTRVITLYSGTSEPAGNNGGGVEQWNREHVWAQSHGDFGTTAGPGTDLHHLRPEDVTVNGARGNLDFDEGGTQNAEAPGNYADGDSWEPRDAVKGDVARMLFYMAVRYEGGDGFADLELNDRAGNGATPFHGRLSTLLDWHAQDPPTAAEVTRNDVVQQRYQGNRNPFVDHPEWAVSIWG